MGDNSNGISDINFVAHILHVLVVIEDRPMFGLYFNKTTGTYLLTYLLVLNVLFYHNTINNYDRLYSIYQNFM